MLLLRMLCLLMLMFLLRDADSVCPIEPNPLSVHPDVAVEEYGGQLHVNCTSDNEEYEDTIWKVEKEGVLTEDDYKLPSLNLSLTDWNMNVECIIKMNDTHECSKDVDLTIYKNPEVVLSIIDVQALGEEKLYELQCDVLNVAPVQYLTVKWYTNDELSKTDSFSDTTRTPVNESRTLNLTVRREDNVVEVRCEAQLGLESHGRPLPAISQTVSAHYANRTCGTDVNPLTVEPAVIIAAYGEKVVVNCTSDREEHEGIFWRVGNKDLRVEEDESIASLSSSLTDWNMKAECVIQYKTQSDTHECSRDVEINVYKNPEVVLSIINEQALGEETLYELQCDVLNVAPVQYLTVRWYTNNELNKTESFSDTTRTPVNESRTLSLTVRREDNVVEVRCEAQLDFRQNESLPTVSETHNVSAYYAPELKVKNDTEDIYALEGTDISLNCEAEGNPPPVFHWTGDELNVSVDTDILNITQVNAGSVYICTATNYLGHKTKHFHIHGTNKKIEATSASAPIPKAAETGCPVTLTPPEVVVRFGDPVSVNCSASDVDGLGWESTVGGTGLEIVTFRTWTVEKLENWNENASCYASVGDIQCQKYLDITVYQTPDTVFIRDGGPMLEGIQYQLQCSINNVAPVQKLKVKWYRGGEILSEDTFSNTTLTPVSVTSKLTIIPTKEDNGALFRCQAELHLGPNGPEVLPNTTSEPYAAVVYYKPIINSCALHNSVVEHEYSLDMLACNADGNPPPTIKWYYKDKEVMNSSALLSRTDSGNYRAEFENRMGRNSVPVDITVEYGPSFTCKKSYDVEVNGKLQCEPEGIPTPRLTWFKDGKKIVPPQPWTKQDSGEYSINASNIHGSDSYVLNVNILYPPEFKEVQGDHEFIQGENVTLNCSAEGNPPPKIQWSHTSSGNSEPTVWRQNTITITGATSTSSGVYICVATNKVGNVTRSVTLMMKGTSDFPYAVLWALIIAGIIIFMIVAVFVYRNRMNKQGQYSFVRNGDVPMTTVTTGEKS